MRTKCHLKIDGIADEAVDGMPEGAIEVLNWSFGATNSGSTSIHREEGSWTDTVQMQDFRFTHRMSRATPGLFRACVTGQRIKDAVLTCRKDGEPQAEYLSLKFESIEVTSFELTNVVISSLQADSSAVDEIPIAEVSLSFAKIETVYRPQMSDGTPGNPIQAGYDITLDREV